MFQDVSAVIFFVGLSDYDRFCYINGDYHNRLEDARDLFESLLNSPSFEVRCGDQGVVLLWAFLVGA
jgi:hypothetical protein